MRRKVIAGNWKMNKDINETKQLLSELKELVKDVDSTIEVIVCPPFPSLQLAKELLVGTKIKLGAQNVHYEDNGAYTGEVSTRMLKAIGCEYVIIGHSERRTYFKESDEIINRKVKKTLSVGLTPIICVGEALDERERGITEVVVGKQVKGVLAGLSENDMANLVIAYEPVWAIGTGRNASPEQANEVHQFIRNLVSKLFNSEIASKLIIQYGGSVKPENAADLLNQSEIDGALVGGACLKAQSFEEIIRAASSGNRKL